MGTRASTRHRAAGWVGIAAVAAWLAASLLPAPANAQATFDDEAPARVGRIADVGGEVYHAPEDRASDWSAIGLNYPIASGDNLWVAEGGRAEIDVGVAQLRLGGETNVHVARLDDRAMAFFLAQGRAIVRLRALDAGEVARIDTPNTQIVLTRPGLYRIDVTPDRLRTTLVVREGEATMPTQGGMQQVLPGQTAQADGLDATYVDVRHGIATDGFDTWSANRDRRYQRRTATQYVSPQMVGYADLDDYGRWESDATYGAVWYPTLGSDPDWAPYRNGYWTNVAAYGWTWVDSAPWGYAPSHYGRWVHNGGRWGWCPGAYIARPYWAPAMVGWVGGSGWATLGIGGPVYAWAPLAWGEPMRPWWGNCTYRCWTNYNRPYAVRTDERNYRAPPTQYVNANRPGGVTAVGSATFTGQRPVRANLVNVPPSQAAALPVALSAPSARPTGALKPLVKPGTSNTPPPASTFYTTSRRDPIARPAFPGTSTVTSVPGATKPGSNNASTSVPMPRAAPARDYPTSPPSAYAQPSSKPSPAPSVPMTSTPPSTPPPTRYAAPVQRETVQPYSPPQRAAQPMVTTPVQRETAQPYAPPPQRIATPQPHPQPAQSAPSAGVPMPPARIAPQPAPQVQHAPPPAPVIVPQAPPPQPAARGQNNNNNNDGGGRGGSGGGSDGGGGGGDRGAGPKPGQR
jgi:uncharacterized membrane protein YgcG